MTSDAPKAPFGAILIATWFGSGLLPTAPGTWGSLAALPFAWALVAAGGVLALAAAAIVATVIGAWAAQAYAEAMEEKDPGRVVIDEVVGQWLALLPVAVVAGPLWSWVVAFIAFRAFDITKPWPARRLEKLQGGLGIIADDIAAGVYAAIVVTLFLVLF